VFPFLSVAENLAMGAYARAKGAAVTRDLDQVYEWFPRLKERHRQAAGLLSGGEQQMVAIGRAYMGRPKLLLLDEPSLGLSPLFTKEIFAIVRRIRDQAGIAVLVVEQNAAIALASADHGYVLELGRVVASDTCAALAQRQDIKDFYLGGPSHAASESGMGSTRSTRRRSAWA
jgi:branched-chain amino acid transport system ATP-binding protein